MTRRLRFGVLGCAAIAWRRTLPALRRCPHAEVTAVASRDPEKARRFAAEFDCAATTYDGLLSRDDVDAVYLPLPPALHLGWGAEALHSGKHVLTEKPLASTGRQARELVRIARASGRLVRENFMFLHHPQHARVREVLAEGRLGQLRSFRAAFGIPPLPADDVRYRPEVGGGALLDVGVYPIRSAQLFLGDDLRVAGASLRTAPGSGITLAGQALLVSSDGVLADLEFGFQHAYASYYELWGSEGRLHLDRAFTPPPTRRPVLRIEGSSGSEQEAAPAANQFELAVSDFAEAALAGRTSTDRDEAVRIAAAVRTVEIVDEIQEAALVVAGVPERTRNGAVAYSEQSMEAGP